MPSFFVCDCFLVLLRSLLRFRAIHRQLRTCAIQRLWQGLPSHTSGSTRHVSDQASECQVGCGCRPRS